MTVIIHIAERSIAKAMQLIASNPDNPRTILLPRSYSHTQNDKLSQEG
jgi:hypothetical protein